MAVLNIRVDDRVRDQLKELADDEGLSLSAYVRNLVLEAVVPVYEQGVKHGDEPAQDTLRIIDRQVLSMLHRILGRVLPEDSNDVDGDLEYQLMRAQILEAGYTGEYWLETAGFRTELSKRDCGRVKDILDMFRIVTYSIDHIEKDGHDLGDDELRRGLEFRGFDHNHALESHMASYVKFLMSDDRWPELRPQVERHDRGNSHYPVLDRYMRMLTQYRRIMDSRKRGLSRPGPFLTVEELRQINDASTHPSNRSPRVADDEAPTLDSSNREPKL